MRRLRRAADLLDAAEPFRNAADGGERRGLHRFCPMLPNSEPQRAFFDSDEFILAMLGGTGGGKTYGLVGAALRFMDRPGYKALIIRRTHPALAAPDGPIWTSQEMLEGVSHATWRATEKRWVFKHPSGPPSVLQFASCDHDDAVHRLMGPSYDMIGIDELPEFATPKVWSTLITRFRRKAGSDIPSRLRATGNPGGPGQRWVVEQLVRRGLHVHSTYRDNPAIDREDYGLKLAELPETMRAWYDEGDFDARPSGLIYPLHRAHEWGGISLLPGYREDGWSAVLAHDPGTSVYKPTMAFCLILWNAHDASKVYISRAVKLFGGGDVERAIEAGAKYIRGVKEDFPDCTVVVDPGAFGEDFIEAYKTRFGIWCEAVPKSPGYKRTAQLVVRGMIEGDPERGNPSQIFVDREACKPLVEEAGDLTWAEDGLTEDPAFPNHCCDAMLYGIMRTPAYLQSRQRAPVRTAEDQARHEAAERKRRKARKEQDDGGWRRR